MELKKLGKPRKLKFYECLEGRREFDAEEKYRLYTLKRGYYQGEFCFNKLAVKHVDEDALIISDLVVSDGHWYQIDCIVIAGDKLYLLEIKHLRGPLAYIDGDLHLDGEKMKDDLLRKLRRVKEMLEYALRRRGFDIEVVPKLIFMNPEMSFYGNTPELPVLMYHQVESFLKSTTASGVYQNQRLARFLLSLHTDDNPFDKEKIPPDFATLIKGILCPGCRIKLEIKNNTRLQCDRCGYEESKKDGVKRNIWEYQVLYPDKKVLAKDIHKWCGKEISKRTIHHAQNSLMVTK